MMTGFFLQEKVNILVERLTIIPMFLKFLHNIFLEKCYISWLLLKSIIYLELLAMKLFILVFEISNRFDNNHLLQFT